MAESDFYKGIFVGILFGVILGPFFLSLYIYHPPIVSFLAKALSTVNLPTFVLNRLDPLPKAFIEGEIDGVYLASIGVKICRSTNIKKAIDIISYNANLPCIKYENGQIVCPSIPVQNATLFVIFNNEHLRTAVYENNTLTIIDLLDPYYKFNPSYTTILACHIIPLGEGFNFNIETKCDVIYVNGLRAFNNPEDYFLYEEVFEYNHVDVVG